MNLKIFKKARLNISIAFLVVVSLIATSCALSEKKSENGENTKKKEFDIDVKCSKDHYEWNNSNDDLIREFWCWSPERLAPALMVIQCKDKTVQMLGSENFFVCSTIDNRNVRITLE